MNLRQMEYLYMYGSKYQLETVRALANLAVEQVDVSLQEDLLGLIRWVMQYADNGSYAVFFLEFCMVIDRDKEAYEISTKEAIEFQEGTYGELKEM